MSGTYAQLLSAAEVSLGDLRGGAVQPLTGYDTVNPAFSSQLSGARESLQKYFDDSERSTPYNCLLLGPPGSGKSFLARRLGSAVDAEFFEFNLSELLNAAELSRALRTVAEDQAPRKIVLLDEFDLRVGGSALIRFLIRPMYDGQFGGEENRSLGKVAFVFSGSYLKSREVLQAIQGEYSRFDLLRLLYDIHRHSTPDLVEEVASIFHLSVEYQRFKEATAPDRDVFGYLRSLEKLPDFLSRINGFVLEIPDLSSPLETTEPWYALLRNDNRQDLNVRAEAPEKVLEFAKESPSYEKVLAPQYDSPATPVLEYKDMLLKERLLRTLDKLLRRFGGEEATGGGEGGLWRWPWRLRGPRSERSCELRIRRLTLNYLVVAPLVHGMRSLNYLAEEVALGADGSLKLAVKDSDLAKRHIRRDFRFKDPNVVWRRLVVENELKCWASGEQDQEILLRN